MYAFNWALTAFRSESYIGSATALPDAHGVNGTCMCMYDVAINVGFYIDTKL